MRLAHWSTLLVVALVPALSAQAQDPLPGEPGYHGPSISVPGSSRVGSSPFTPPEANDSTFVIDDDVGLDTGCTFRSGGPLVFTVEVGRVIGDKAELLSRGLLSDTATLRMPAFDVDYDGTPPPERDRVWFNGNVVPTEFLTGSNNVWKLNAFSIPIDWVNFAADPGLGGTAVAGLNIIRIDIDTANTSERWCTEIDWAALEVEKIPRPVLMFHGIFSDGDIWEVTWERRLDELGIPNDGDLNMGALDSIADNAAKIASRVAQARQRWGVDRVVIASHSKGGLDSRHYIESNDDVERLIQLGTPNAGSPLADKAQIGSLLIPGGLGLNLLINKLAGPAGVQLTTPYMAVYNLLHGANARTQYTAVAGDYDPDCFVFNSFCKIKERFLLAASGSPGDTIVPVWSVHALSYTDDRTFPSSGNNKESTHGGLHGSDAVFNLVQSRVTAPGTNQSVAAPALPALISTASVGGTIQQGQTQDRLIALDEANETLFVLFYPSGQLDPTLVSPSGMVIDPLVAATDPDVYFEEGDIPGGRLAIYGLAAPELGAWTLRIGASLVVEPGGEVAYAGSALIREPAIVFTGRLPQAVVGIGETLLLEGTVTEQGAPAAGATVSASLALPDATARTVQLLDDGSGPDLVAGDGVFAAEFTETTQPGNYRVAFAASRTGSGSGPDFSREAFAIGTVAKADSTFTGAFSDYGVDGNGDGLFDELVIEVGVQTNVAADFKVLGLLEDSLGNRLDAGAAATLTPGASSMLLAFPGDLIYQNRVDGPFTLKVVRLAEVDQFVLALTDELTDAHETAAYSFDQFQPALLFLTGVGSSTVRDVTGDWRWDYLDVTLDVQVAAAGFYEWSARLTDGNGTEIGFASGAATLSAGANQISLTFDGTPIGLNGVDGPYFVSEFLLFGGSASLVASRALTTAAYFASQFAAGSPPGACGFPDEENLEGLQVHTAQVFRACSLIRAADVEVTETGEASLLSEGVIVLGEGFRVRPGGRLVAATGPQSVP